MMQQDTDFIMFDFPVDGGFPNWRTPSNEKCQ